MLCFGILMLISPRQAINLQARLTRTARWLRSDSEWKASLQWRLAGLAFVVIAVIMLRPVIWELFSGPVPRPVRAKPTQTISAVPNWHSLAIAIAMIAGGFYVLIKPQSFLRWAARRAPYLSFVEGESPKATFGARIIGVLGLGAGVFTLGLWARSIL